MAKGRIVAKRLTILICADAVAHTGFSSVTHGLAEQFSKRHNVAILGVNYHGDPHSYSYPIYPASLGGDVYGIRRLKSLIAHVKPDVILVINDPWIVKDYLDVLGGTNIPVVCYSPVDGTNVRSEFAEGMNRCAHVVAYNRFGLDQLQQAGLTAQASFVPHGVDTSVFFPIDKREAREKLQIPDDWFIVGCSNRNQPRKRLDLMVEYFAAFAKDKPNSVRLYYHGALQDAGYDLVQLCKYYDIEDRFVITSPNITPAQGVPREMLRHIYSSWDIQITTTNGEGHGMTTHEGMACCVPQIAPDWAALGDWPKGGIELVPCSAVEVRTGGINTIGGIADKDMFIAVLDRLYSDDVARAVLAKRGFDIGTSPAFQWPNVAEHFLSIFRAVTA